MRGDRRAVREAHDPRRAARLQAGHLPRGEDLGAELRRLPPGPLGELPAGHAVGEAEVVLDAGALAGLAAGRRPLHQHRAQALRGAVHGRTEPGRAAADHHQVVEVGRRRGRQTHTGGQLGCLGFHQRGPVRRDHHRQPLPVLPGRREQPPSLRLVRGVPAVGHLVAGQELPDLRGPRRPAVPDDLGAGHRTVVAGAPGLEQVVQDRVELLLGRVPGLEQVVVQVDDVDRVDRRLGVRVRRQQHPAGARVHVHGLLQELDAVHLRHAVVREDHGHQVPAQLELAQRLQRRLAGLRAHDPAGGAVASPQVAGDGAGDPRIVVHGHDDGPRLPVGLCHASPSRAAGFTARRPRHRTGLQPIVCSIAGPRSGGAGAPAPARSPLRGDGDGLGKTGRHERRDRDTGRDPHDAPDHGRPGRFAGEPGRTGLGGEGGGTPGDPAARRARLAVPGPGRGRHGEPRDPGDVGP